MNFSHDWLPRYELVMDYDPDGKRFYVTPSGQQVYSATTQLKALTEHSIEAWRERVGEKEAARILKAAGDRGTAVHTICEQYLLNNAAWPEYYTDSNRGPFNMLQPYLDKHITEIRALEYNLFSETLQIAGTTDCIANWNGELAVIDFKTGRKERWDYLTYHLQATLYAILAGQMYGLPIKKCVILMALDELMDTGQPGVKVIEFEPHKYVRKVLSVIGG
jgi:ATP-dependent exoDNAse (exonuclease V) beta subunit